MDYSMFGAMLPQQAQEEDMRSRMVSPNTFAQLNPLQQIVALGGNAGAMVGGAVGNMMGGRTSKEAEGAMIKEVFDKASQVSEDPAEQYAFASKEFRRLGMNDRAMALEDRVLKTQKEQADILRLKAIANRPGGGSGGGTGPERMATFVANVQARIAAGEPVSEEERLRAQGFADVLSKNQFFQQDDGSIVSVPKNDYGRVRQLLSDGAVEIPSPLGGQPQTVPAQGTQQPAPQGQRPAPQQTPPRSAAPPARANVISTPDSTAAAEKKTKADQQNAALFENDILQIDKALDIVEKSGSSAAGWGSLLSWVPESKALDLNATLGSIDAQKLVNQIQALKETSATGSTGFGSLTEREGQLLMDRLGALRQGQSPAVLKESLSDIRRLMGKLVGRDPKDRPGQFSEAQEQIISKTMAANKGKTREQVINGLKKKGYLK
jgi:hypothetical protein